MCHPSPRLSTVPFFQVWSPPQDQNLVFSWTSLACCPIPKAISSSLFFQVWSPPQDQTLVFLDSLCVLSHPQGSTGKIDFNQPLSMLCAGKTEIYLSVGTMSCPSMHTVHLWTNKHRKGRKG